MGIGRRRIDALPDDSGQLGDSEPLVESAATALANSCEARPADSDQLVDSALTAPAVSSVAQAADPEPLAGSAARCARKLADVRRAVIEIQSGQFGTVGDLQKSKARLAGAVDAAKKAGASEADLLEASAAKQTLDLEDQDAAGAAAKRARKLRHTLQEEKRDMRLAEKAICRKEQKAKEIEERDQRIAQAAAERKERKSKVKEDEEAKAKLDEARANEIANRVVGVQPGMRGRSPLRLNFASSGSADKRSRSRSARAIRTAPITSVSRVVENARRLPPAVPQSSDVRPKPDTSEESVPSLAALLGRPEKSDILSQNLAELTTLNHPLGRGVGQLTAGFYNANAHLSTGGGQTCYQFSQGKCSRWQCKFKHVGR